MHIQVNTDSHVEGRDELIREVQATVENSLGRFAQQLTRVEVHLNDENSHKGGDADKRCLMEARPAGMQPIAVTHHGATLDQAVNGAVKKLRTVLDSTFGRLADKKGRTPFGGEPTA
jgi:hypothetical protein